MSTRRPVPKGKRRFSIYGTVVVHVYTEVDASSFEEAKQIAEGRGVQSLCQQCSGGEADREWSLRHGLGDAVEIDLAIQWRDASWARLCDGLGDAVEIDPDPEAHTEIDG